MDAERHWTIDTLYIHFDRLLVEMSKRFDERIGSVEKAAAAAIASSEKAIGKAENASEKRLDGMNEFRATLGDQQAEFRKSLGVLIGRPEFDVRIAALEKENASNGSRIDRIEAKGLGIQAGWGILVTVLTLGALLFGVVMALRK
jgi:hypothetical protein